MCASKGDTNKNRKQPVKNWLKSLGITGAQIFSLGSHDFRIRLSNGEVHNAHVINADNIECKSLQKG